MPNDKTNDGSSKTDSTLSHKGIVVLETANLEAELGEELKKVNLAKPQKAQIQSSVLQLFKRHEYHSGPLPSASQFRSYEEVCPGSADRILAMAEREQAHRHTCELEAAAFEQRYSKTGLWMGFFIAGLLVCSAVVVALYGHEIVASALVAASAVGMVATFINGGAGPVKGPPRESKSQQAPGTSAAKGGRQRR